MCTHIHVYTKIYVCIGCMCVFIILLLKDSGITWEIFLCFKNNVFPGGHLLRTHLWGHLSLDNWWTQCTWKPQTPHPAYIGPFSALLTRGPGFRSFRNTGFYPMSILWHLGPRARSDVRTIGSYYCDKFTFYMRSKEHICIHAGRRPWRIFWLCFSF